MATRTQSSSKHILGSLPPICYFPERIRARMETRSILAIHLAIVASLYSIFFIVAFFEGTLLIDGGIGVIQNEPFFIHFVSAILSIPIVLIMAKRVSQLSNEIETAPIIVTVLDALQDSRFKNFLYWSAALVGLFAFAYNIVLSISYQIDIYDSVRHFPSFITYLPIRIYLYIFCYPFIVVTPVVVVIYLFKSLHASALRYRPFHPDGLGGLRPFLVAVDRPVYAVQSIAVLIAVMNYLGWGGLELVPTVLAMAAPVLVTLLAFLLFFLFYRALSDKKKHELHKLHQEQTALYERLSNPSQEREKGMSDLIGEIEATERLVVLINRRRGKYWIKYFINLTPILLSQIREIAYHPEITGIIQSFQ